MRYRFIIIEGWTYNQLREALRLESVLVDETTHLDGDSRVLLAIDEALTEPEGWFLPANLSLVPTDYKLTIAFAILVIVLLFRPTGIFKGAST